ncbi:hypothetical protein QUB68_02540 [Microcoleus sp. A006_D1]|uniref:hypothetical protein n=1 Tax=Microcoleus sp. A006_D1 TaxID=3055267 RepID=UPI002FD47BED
MRISVVGSRTAVLQTIHTFYRLGFAAVGDGRRPQPTAGPGQVVSVLIRRQPPPKAYKLGCYSQFCGAPSAGNSRWIVKF